MNRDFEQRRRSIRLPEFDYTQPGAYFVTFCTHRRQHLFGEIINGCVLLNWIGKIVQEEWWKTEVIRRNIMLDQFVIMPNHFHAIFFVIEYTNDPDRVGAHCNAPLHRPARSVASMIALFKGSVTRCVREISADPSLIIWQRNYYERVIRNEFVLNRFRHYIIQNPHRWELDRYYSPS